VVIKRERGKCQRTYKVAERALLQWLACFTLRIQFACSVALLSCPIDGFVLGS
jgi:hypothetical protein